MIIKNAIHIVSNNINIIGLIPTHINLAKLDFMPIAAIAVTSANREKSVESWVTTSGTSKKEFANINNTKTIKNKGILADLASATDDLLVLFNKKQHHHYYRHKHTHSYQFY